MTQKGAREEAEESQGARYVALVHLKSTGKGLHLQETPSGSKALTHGTPRRKHSEIWLVCCLHGGCWWGGNCLGVFLSFSSFPLLLFIKHLYDRSSLMQGVRADA